MPRSFLIKKHFGCQAKKRSLHDDDTIESKQPEDLTSRASSTTPDPPTSAYAITPPPAVALIARPPDDLEQPDLNTSSSGGVWQHKSVIPPYLPFNFTTMFPAFPQSPSSDYYHQVGARLVPPLYSLSPPQRTASLPVEQLSPYESREASSPLKKSEPLAPLPVNPGNNNNTPTINSYNNSNGITGLVSGSLSPSSSTGSSPSSNGSFLYQLWTSSSSVASGSGDKSPGSVGENGGDATKKQRREAPRYQCSDCNKSYSTFSGLTKHQQFHCITQAKKSFSCKYCEKVYVSLGALKMHIRTHTLPCKCKLCGKAFSRPWLLQGHIRTHTGEKPFACPHCNRAFADRSNLRAHLQTHSDVKKYSCKSCSKTFSRMSLLLKHEDGGCPNPHPH